MSLTETQHTGEFIIAEPEPQISRQNVTVTVASGVKLQPGHVMSKLSATGKYVEYDNAGTDGSEAAAGVLYGECDNTDGVAPVDFSAVVVTRLAAVRKSDLKWASGVDSTGKTAAYADMAATLLIAKD